MAKTIFRKIGGKIVPIKIKNVKDPYSGQSSPFTKERKIVAETDKGEFIGQLSLTVPKTNKYVTVTDVRVNEKFQRKGIATELFKKVQDFSRRAKKDYIRTGLNIENPAQVKIREKLGKSAFIAEDQYRGTRTKVSAVDAINKIKRNKTGGNKEFNIILATTSTKRKK